MNNENRLNLVAPCGLDCGICELYLSKDNPQLYMQLIAMGIPEEKIPCEGCREIQGNCPVMGETCATYKCAGKEQINFCSECTKFPCVKLQPLADRAGSLPHNMKIYNLCEIERFGLEAFAANSGKIKKRYFKGKMVLGEGPIA